MFVNLSVMEFNKGIFSEKEITVDVGYVIYVNPIDHTLSTVIVKTENEIVSSCVVKENSEELKNRIEKIKNETLNTLDRLIEIAKEG